MATRVVTRKPSPEKLADVAQEFNFSDVDVKSISDELEEPEWLTERRMRAWEAYRSLPMPSQSDEAWRRTDIRKLPATEVSLIPVDDVSPVEDALQPLGGGEREALLVLRPGRESSLEGGEALEDLGVVFCDWATAVREHPSLLETYMGTAVAAEEGKFAALATALSTEGALIYVPPGVTLENPLHLLLWAPAAKGAFFSRVLVVVDEGASATFVSESASPTEAEGGYVHGGIVELVVADGATLRFVELQNWGQHVWNITHERAKVGREGDLDWIFGSVGSLLTKTFTEIDLEGEGAQGRMSGFYVASGRQVLDHDTQQNHLSPHTTSDLLFKGALTGRSRSVWQGMIYVAPGAQKSDGYQANRNLILSQRARADSIPGLEILADDVRCTHGATVGQLDEEPIFYLMSRGIPKTQAERLLIDGFFAPVMDRIPYEDVRQRFGTMIQEKLG